MDDNEQEKNVIATAADSMLTSNFIDSAKGEISPEAVARDAEIADLAVLFRDYHKTIFRVAYRITGNRSDAEDVLQTVFLRLTAPNRRDFSPNPAGYLHRAAVNASLDLIRSRKRTNSVSLDVVDFDESAKFSAASPEDDLVGAELRALLRQAIAKLDGRAATAFALRYFEGLDNNCIAQILGTSQMVVAVTLHRARTRLRKEIGSYLEKNYEAQ